MQTENKNILYIGPYRQADGWGYASKDYLLSLLHTNNNIACAPIYLNGSAAYDIKHPLILQAENTSLPNIDIVIQKTLPMGMVSRYDARNIGMLFLENRKLESNSIYNLQGMDTILLSSQKEVDCLINSGITKPCYSISHPLPIDSLKSVLDKNIKIGFNNYSINKTFKFYFIGENIQRKNIKDIIIAFNLEFEPHEDVSLVIKTSVPGMNEYESLNYVRGEISRIKQKLRTRTEFKDEIVITSRLDESQLFALHASCDCFVCVSYGEAFCRPAAEAVCFGNPVILTNNIGSYEDIDENDRYIVQTQDQPVIIDDPSYVAGLDFYNAYESWAIPSIIDLRSKMRQAYLDKKTLEVDKYHKKFSYENIGKKICHHI